MKHTLETLKDIKAANEHELRLALYDCVEVVKAASILIAYFTGLKEEELTRRGDGELEHYLNLRAAVLGLGQRHSGDGDAD